MPTLAFVLEKTNRKLHAIDLELAHCGGYAIDIYTSDLGFTPHSAAISGAPHEAVCGVHADHAAHRRQLRHLSSHEGHDSHDGDHDDECPAMPSGAASFSSVAAMILTVAFSMLVL